MIRFVAVACVGILAGCASQPAPKPASRVGSGDTKVEPQSPRLGNFSVSLSVKDLAASRAFYERVGFLARGGDGKRWLVMQNETATIGLFQGFFDKNILTFNPGWDRDKKTLADFDDVRDIQRTLESRGLTLTTKADPSTTGPASLTLTDPDGNMILVDQHVPSPAKK